MYEKHDLFKAPPNSSQKIWRYVDITKLLDLINSNSLYFARADHFEDIFEGSYTKKSVEVRGDYYAKLGQHSIVSASYTPEFWSKSNQELKKEIGLNCWHMNDFESAAMWKLYLKSNEGIAIQSNYERLVKCFRLTDIRVFIGTLNYIDYEKEFIDFENSLRPYLHKRRSFEHEREIRCLIWQADQSDESTTLFSGGLKINIDLIELIENIYISPDSPKWLMTLLEDILKKYDLKIPVINSRLKELPLF